MLEKLNFTERNELRAKYVEKIREIFKELKDEDNCDVFDFKLNTIMMLLIDVIFDWSNNPKAFLEAGRMFRINFKRSMEINAKVAFKSSSDDEPEDDDNLKHLKEQVKEIKDLFERLKKLSGR